ncbi:hypothetical protein DOH45_23965 [Salmonella enterica subsp. enterica serovar Enteritidis]|nr:hypothetical protein [Salmonella enterica subsp. enterica serovar Enteritidis]
MKPGMKFRALLILLFYLENKVMNFLMRVRKAMSLLTVANNAPLFLVRKVKSVLKVVKHVLWYPVVDRVELVALVVTLVLELVVMALALALVVMALAAMGADQVAQALAEVLAQDLAGLVVLVAVLVAPPVAVIREALVTVMKTLFHLER